MRIHFVLFSLLTLNTCFSQDNSTGWEQLKAETRKSAIVGLGEESHGVESFNQIKADVSAFLLKEKKVNAIVFESSFVACMINYLNKSPLEVRIKQSLYPFWNTTSVRTALKEFVAVESDQPLITGCDMQEDCRLGASSNYLLAENIISKTKAQLLSCDSILRKVIGTKLSRYSLTEEEYKNLCQQYEQVRLELHAKKDELGERFSILDHCLTNRLWLCKYVTNSVQSKMRYRDSLMALNVIWLKNNIYQSKPFILWAANLHVAKLTGNRKPEWTGEWLSDQNYYSIGVKKGSTSSRTPLEDNYSISFSQVNNYDAVIYSRKNKKINSSEWVTPCD